MGSKKMVKGRTLLPVVGPLVALLALTGLSRAGQVITQARKGDTSVVREGRVRVNATEATYARYGEATKLLEGGSTAEALRDLAGIREEKIVVDGSMFVGDEIRNFSPTTVMMRLGRALSAQAKSAAERGDRETAERCAVACRAVAEHVLASPEQTLEALKLAHFFDVQAASTEKVVYALRADGGQAAEAADRRFDWLMQVWKGEILPQIARVRERTHAAQGRYALTDAQLDSSAAEERALAEHLSQEYRARRASLLGLA